MMMMISGKDGRTSFICDTNDTGVEVDGYKMSPSTFCWRCRRRRFDVLSPSTSTPVWTRHYDASLAPYMKGVQSFPISSCQRPGFGAIRYKKLSYCCDSRSYGAQEYDRIKRLLRDICFNAIHCDRSFSTCEEKC